MQVWTKNKVTCHPWHAIPEQMTQLGLTAEDGMNCVWFVDENGRLTHSAEAINQAMKQCWWANPLTHLYSIPGIQHLQEKIYRWVANNRHRMPGGTATCQLPSANNKEL